MQPSRAGSSPKGMDIFTQKTHADLTSTIQIKQDEYQKMPREGKQFESIRQNETERHADGDWTKLNNFRGRGCFTHGPLVGPWPHEKSICRHQNGEVPLGWAPASWSNSCFPLPTSSKPRSREHTWAMVAKLGRKLLETPDYGKIWSLYIWNQWGQFPKPSKAEWFYLPW